MSVPIIGNIASNIGSALTSGMFGYSGPRTIANLSSYDYDFVANTQKGAPITFGVYGANTDAFKIANYGFTGSWLEWADGIVRPGAAALRRTDLGFWIMRGAYCNSLWNRDLTNAAWVKTNMTAALTQVGCDAVANSATLLTATAANATVLQPITLASALTLGSCFIKRITGTGAVQMTIDGGTTWTTLTFTGAYSRVSIPTQTLANPSIGFRVVTSGDAITVDAVMCSGPYNYAPTCMAVVIFTTTAAVLDYGDRPSAMIDMYTSPLPPLLRTPHGFYFEGSMGSPAGGALCVADSGYQVLVNANGSVTINNSGGVTGPASQWSFSSRFKKNKVCGYFDASGNVHYSVNGNTVVTANIGLSPIINHMDLCTNGDQAACGNTILTHLSYFNGGVLTDADVVAFST